MKPIERQFLKTQQIARLATADLEGVPHVIPVCFVLIENTVYIAIDRKPKRADITSLKRLRNIRENNAVALIADHYEDDWQRLGWVMLRGRAEILDTGSERDQAQRDLRDLYPQYRDMNLDDLPVIAIRIERVSSWGKLD